MKTIESIFIEQYEDTKKELEIAKQEIEKLKEENKKEDLILPSIISTTSTETCILRVDDAYYIRNSKLFKESSSNDIKKILEDDKKLRELANEINDYHSTSFSYSDTRFVNVKRTVFPYTARLNGVIVGIDLYNDCSDVTSSIIHTIKKDGPKTNRYFIAEDEKELYEFGLSMFKENLEKVYTYKVKEEEGDQ